MRNAVLTLIALLACAAVCGSALAAGRGSSRPRCPPVKHEEVLAADRQALVYVAAPPSEEPLEGVFGCSHSSGKSYLLGPRLSGGSAGGGGVFPIALAGSVVAFGIGHSLEEGHYIAEIRVRDLRTGRLLHRVPNGTPARPGDVGIGETTQVVVKADGAVAWITHARPELGELQVRSVDQTGSHLLAASPGIASHSLVLVGSTLYWKQGGKPFSATLR